MQVAMKPHETSVDSCSRITNDKALQGLTEALIPL